MDRNAKKQGKMKVLFPYAILVFQIFWQKIGEIQQRKKGAPYFVQSRSEAKLYKQLSTTKTIAVYKMQSPIHDGPCVSTFKCICHLKGSSDLSRGYIPKKKNIDGI